jgi:transposase
MDMTKIRFARALKIEAVRLVTDRGVAMAQAARGLNVVESVLRRWMRKLAATLATAPSGNGQMRSDIAEIAALEKQVVQLQSEYHIRKKKAVGSTGQRNIFDLRMR